MTKSAVVWPIHHGSITRPSRALVEEFKKLGTSTIGNVLDDMGIAGIILNLKPLAPGSRFTGTAYTVKQVTGVHGTYSSAEFGLGEVIDHAEAGDVIIIDNGGQQVSTWGGVAAFAAQKRGVAGLVIDGGMRDADEIIDLKFPAFSRYVVPLSGKTRVKVVAINVPVKIDNVRVDAGDIVVGDSTGIVRIPAAVAQEVLGIAMKLERDDRQAMEDIANGLSFRDALAKFSKL